MTRTLVTINYCKFTSSIPSYSNTNLRNRFYSNATAPQLLLGQVSVSKGAPMHHPSRNIAGHTRQIPLARKALTKAPCLLSPLAHTIKIDCPKLAAQGPARRHRLLRLGESGIWCGTFLSHTTSWHRRHRHSPSGGVRCVSTSQHFGNHNFEWHMNGMNSSSLTST
jgi:hypothetical protein